jgi:micrococcal nuclease
VSPLSRALTMVAAAAALAVPAVWASPAAAASRPKNVPKNSIEVTVKKVVDANAIDVVTAKGRTVRIGLLEAESPDRGQCWNEEALKRLKELLPDGKRAYLRTVKPLPFDDGRYLVYVWSRSGDFVNRDLVAKGYAQASPFGRKYAYTESILRAQSKAQDTRLGIWSEACGEAAQRPLVVDLHVPQDSASVRQGGGTLVMPEIRGTDRPRSPERYIRGANPFEPAQPQPGAPAASATQPSGSGVDPRFRTCAEAIRYGYGDYRRGIDPEYDWYRDADGDGVACER